MNGRTFLALGVAGTLAAACAPPAGAQDAARDRTLPPASAPPQALHPRWAPDGSALAYYRRDGADAHLFVVGPDGIPLQATVGPGNRAFPTWSPDSKRLAFVLRTDDGGGDVWILDLGSGDLTRVTRTAAREAHTSWSPDGERIAFVAPGPDGGLDVWTVGADGADPTRLTSDPGDEYHPKWSPDGRRIAYDGGGAGARGVRVVDVASGHVTVVTDPAVDPPAVTPAWEPGGRALVYERIEHGVGNLWRHDLDGGGGRRLTDLAGDSGAPAPRPDGSAIAFHSNHEGTYAVYLLRIPSGEIVRVTP